MISGTPLRFGLIGAGAIAQAYAEAIRRSSRAVVVAVADIREEAAAAIATVHGCDAFPSATDLLEAKIVDAVVVCTPPASHPEICLEALFHGVHVLCEKPLAIDSNGARSILEAANRDGLRFTMASKFRYVDDVIRAKAIVTSGILGDIILFENTFAGRVDMRHRWNSQRDISGGGVLIDNGTHSVDIVRYFLGPLAELQVAEGKRIQELEVEDTVHMFARTVDGVMANIDLSWSLNKESPYYLSIYGSLGTVLVGWKDSKYRRSVDQDWIVFGSGYDKYQAFTRQVDNFAGAIVGDEQLLIKPQDALASVVVIEVAYEALRANDWKAIPSEAETQPMPTTSARA
jgi:predicted dehydrogenase